MEISSADWFTWRSKLIPQLVSFQSFLIGVLPPWSFHPCSFGHPNDSWHEWLSRCLCYPVWLEASDSAPAIEPMPGTATEPIASVFGSDANYPGLTSCSLQPLLLAKDEFSQIDHGSPIQICPAPS